MNKQLASLLCLSLLATMPACRKKSKEEKREEKEMREDISTMLEVSDEVEEAEAKKINKNIIKF